MSIRIGPYTFDQISYDGEADVLYLSIGGPARAVEFDETPEGHAVRLDEHGDLVGLTIVDAQALVEQAGGELVLKLPARANASDLAHSFALAG